MGKVPALELEDGTVLYESTIIADYLDEKFSQNHLHPKDPLQKAKDRILVEQFTKVKYYLVVNKRETKPKLKI